MAVLKSNKISIVRWKEALARIESQFALFGGLLSFAKTW